MILYKFNEPSIHIDFALCMLVLFQRIAYININFRPLYLLTIALVINWSEVFSLIIVHKVFKTWLISVNSKCCFTTACTYPLNEDRYAFILNWMPENNSVVEGSIVTYQCLEGFWYFPNVFAQQITCNTNGKWSAIGSCDSK